MAGGLRQHACNSCIVKGNCEALAGTRAPAAVFEFRVVRRGERNHHGRGVSANVFDYLKGVLWVAVHVDCDHVKRQLQKSRNVVERRRIGRELADRCAAIFRERASDGATPLLVRTNERYRQSRRTAWAGINHIDKGRETRTHCMTPVSRSSTTALSYSEWADREPL